MTIAETYTNKVYGPDPNHQVYRWWVTPKLMVGGSVVDSADYQHLHDDFGIRSVVNVETEHDDSGFGIPNLTQCQVEDNGQRFPPHLVRHVVSFAKLMEGLGPIYVHSQMGGSRSPAFAYAILRWTQGLSPAEALQLIQQGRPWTGGVPYGTFDQHKNYLSSVELALDTTHYRFPWA